MPDGNYLIKTKFGDDHDHGRDFRVERRREQTPHPPRQLTGQCGGSAIFHYLRHEGDGNTLMISCFKGIERYDKTAARHRLARLGSWSWSMEIEVGHT
jgi:hypothetical protein